MFQMYFKRDRANRKAIHFLVLLTSLLLTLFWGQQGNAQDLSIKNAEADLRSTFGIDKLILLNELTTYYQQNQSGKALRYGRRAVALGENLFDGLDRPQDQQQVLQAYFQLGEIFFERENFINSRKSLEAAQILLIDLDNDSYTSKIDSYLQQIQEMEDNGELEEGFLGGLRDIEIGKKLRNTTNDLRIETEIQLANSLSRRKNYQAAIKHYDNAINILKDQGDVERIQDLQMELALVTDSLNMQMEMTKSITEAVKEMEEEEVAAFDIATLELPDLPEIKAEISQLVKVDSILQEKENLKKLSDQYAKEKDYEKSLSYYKKYQDLAIKMAADSILTANEQTRKENQLAMLKQENKIAAMTVESLETKKEKAERERNMAIITTSLVFSSMIIIFYFYFTKRRQHKRLGIAYRDLDKTKNKLETAEQKIVKLLRQQVSGAVAQELLSSGSSQPGGKHFVCIMFLDIRDFTPKVERMSPEEIIDYQNNVFGFMIDIVQKHNGNINQLLGDGFMATFGAPASHGNDCQNAFLAAKEILTEIKERNEAAVIPNTRVGIGLHAGFVVTGNVGNEARKQYSVTGNPVIIASRIEQLNKTYKSQLIITEEVAKKLEQSTQIEQAFLEVDVKGRSTPVKILKIA